jgi:hypothetical protein
MSIAVHPKTSMDPADVLSIWKPVGKEPSALWNSEVNSFNDVFKGLAEYFEQHETYRYSFRSWDPADSLVHSHSTLTMGRIAKWLEHYGLVTHGTEKRKAKADEKPVLFHILKPTLRMREVFEKGELICSTAIMAKAKRPEAGLSSETTT